MRRFLRLFPIVRPFLAIVLTAFMSSSTVLVTDAEAVSPSREAIELWTSQGILDQKLANLSAFHAALPPEIYEDARALHLGRYRSRTVLGTDAVDTIRVVVLLVDFPDYAYNASSYAIPGGGVLNSYVAGTPAMFDSLLFSQSDEDVVNNPTGSMTEFYMENSYGTYFIQGDIFGWYTMPSNYSVYVGTNDGLGGATRTLAAQAVTAAESYGVDFSPYANGGSVVPGVIIIHAGPGAEEGAYG
jgi:hypothetical protein